MEATDFNNLNTIDAVRQRAQNVADGGALNDLRAQALKDPKEALRPVAEQFEALFLQQILKESRKVSFDDGWLDGGQGDFFKDWHDSQLAQTLAAKGSLGLADSIVEQLAPKVDQTYTPEQYKVLMAQRQQNAAQNGADSQSQNTELSTTAAALKLRQL